jgi:hypothetical protein
MERPTCNSKGASKKFGMKSVSLLAAKVAPGVPTARVSGEVERIIDIVQCWPDRTATRPARRHVAPVVLPSAVASNPAIIS